MIIGIVVGAVFLVVFLLLIWSMCVVAARSDKATEEIMRRIERSPQTELIQKYACLNSPEELEALAAERWCGE